MSTPVQATTPTASTSNARDLGGLSTEDGKLVRPGLIFRSDDTAWAGRARPAALPEKIATAIDLRRPAEREERGVPSYVGESTVQVHENLIEESRSRQSRTESEFAGYYIDVFTEKRERIGELVRLLIEDEASPAVINCVAGKDRTGILIAVIQRLLRVHRAEIVSDYARSAVFMAWVRSTGQISEEQLEASAIVLPALTAHPVTMEIFLDHLASQYRDEHGLAEAIGLSRADADRLRERLLVAAPEAEALPSS
jgi:protein tyrosine/serine phosphatase